MTCDLARGWSKVYSSKQDFMDDLWRIGLLTLLECYDGLRSDFDKKDRLLLARAIVEVGALEGAGFVEIVPEKLN